MTATPVPDIVATPAPGDGMVLTTGDTAVVSQAGGGAGRVTLVSAEGSGHARSFAGDGPTSGRFLYVTMTMTATGPGTFAVNPLDFLVRAGSRTVDYAVGTALFALDTGQLPLRTLVAGETATGTIAFDVRKGPVELVYAPGSSSRELAAWHIS